MMLWTSCNVYLDGVAKRAVDARQTRRPRLVITYVTGMSRLDKKQPPDNRSCMHARTTMPFRILKPDEASQVQHGCTR